MITISDTAQAHFISLLADQEANTHIRVFVLNPGTVKAECGVSYCQENEIEKDDKEFAYSGFKIIIDEQSVPFLEEASIDYIQDPLGAQLTLKAPNAKLRKLGDDASLKDRVDYVIQTEINPQLASHGGYITLLDITNEGNAILQFGGGCNGCSMVDYTLKEGIEKQLLDLFPGELVGATDSTEHERGEHSYQ